jgi:hypothetical protein
MYDEDVEEYEVVIKFKFSADDLLVEEIKKDFPNLSTKEAVNIMVEGIKNDLIDDGFSDCEVEVK